MTDALLEARDAYGRHESLPAFDRYAATRDRPDVTADDARPGRRGVLPGGLTAREAEVLALRQDRVSSRTAATAYAFEHALVSATSGR